MRAVCAVLLATTFLATSAFAGSVQQNLAPGKPAGVQQAQTAMTVGSVVLGAGVVLAAALALQAGGADTIIAGTAPLNAGDLAAQEAATLNTTR